MTDYATKLQKFTDTANCLQARDSKGFGRQGMTAVIEISKEDTTMEEMNKATSTQAQTENPAIAQITAILQPKKERLTELMNEESQLRTEVEALELAISTIQNGGNKNA